MSAVGQIRMQAAASRLNSASAQSGNKPDGAAAPAGFENFLAALDRSTLTRLDARGASDKSTSSNRGVNSADMQNLPIKDLRSSQAANSADPMQLLMSQLIAQSMLNQAVAPQNQNVTQQSAEALDPQSGIASQGLIGSSLTRGLDAKQMALITQALSKAIKASGQGADQNSQGQALALLQAFQSQLQVAQTNNLSVDQAADQAKAQLTAQNAAQIASAIESATLKSGVNLPPELKAQLDELINQATPGSIKLLGVESDAKATPSLVSTQAGQVDPAKATTIQNLTDLKNQKIVDAATQDKSQKLKSAESVSSLGFGEKSAAAKAASAESVSSLGFGEKSAAAKAASAEFGKTDNVSNDLPPNVPAQNFDPTLNPNQSTLQHLERNLGPHNAIEMKSSDVSLASGPLHAEILNSAKSGGGRIMLELTPPEQGTIRIDLRINASGQAHLIVEGASDATKSRLDQGGQNLKNEFAQMGLNLSLDLRQGGQSQQMRDQASFGGRQPGYGNVSTNTQTLSSAAAISSIGSGDNRGDRSTVHLYA